MRAIFLVLAAVASTIFPAAAQEPAQPALHYTVVREAILYTEPDTGQAYVDLKYREPVRVLSEKDGWSRVRTRDGAVGYIKSVELSDVWIRVSKSRRTLYLYRGTKLMQSVRADFGTNAFADKERRGGLLNPDDWRTPEGVFYVVGKNSQSRYHKALVLNYPTAEDAERGLQEEIISEREYERIVEAHREQTMPPMNTPLGGWIEIHGDGTGVGSNWTQGCVALADEDMDLVYRWAVVGTPVLIER